MPPPRSSVHKKSTIDVGKDNCSGMSDETLLSAFSETFAKWYFKDKETFRYKENLQWWRKLQKECLPTLKLLVGASNQEEILIDLVFFVGSATHDVEEGDGVEQIEELKAINSRHYARRLHSKLRSS